MKQLGLRGALIGGSVNGEELSDPKFHPFWAKAEELGVLIFIHPQGTGELGASGRLKGNGVLENVIGNPLETTIALSHLIFEGTLDSFPGLKICAAHAGGFLPSYAARSDQGCVTFPGRCTKTLQKKPTEYLRQLYYDSIIFTPEGLRHLIAEVGASQIVLGTDFPFPWTKTAVDHILTTPGLSDTERAAMLGETAEKLLAIKPASLSCTAEALERFASATFAVGVRLEPDDQLHFEAPFGLADLFALQLRPNPRRNTIHFARTSADVHRRWPEVVVDYESISS